MNAIIKSPAALDPNKQQAWTIPDMLFMEAGVQEGIANTIIGLIGSGYSASTPYVLFGCVRSGPADGSAGTVAITAGAIFYNGEVYTVPAVGILLTSGQYVIGNITLTYGTAELLKDGTSTNVQQIRQIAFTGGASGSGNFNQAASVPYNGVYGWIAIGATGAPVFTNSWVNNTSGLQVARLKKENNKIRLSGLIKSGASGGSIFTLPVGPLLPILFSVLASDTSGTPIAAQIEIQASGNVIPVFGGSIDYISLEGIVIPLD